MNSGLPSLLDAIFGKNDLASVSLEEMYEVINEFPSFNAGHYLLSKKLKEQNDAAFEKESMRTALYFHNAFWLQTLLEDENNVWKETTTDSYSEGTEEDVYIEKLTFETIVPAERFSVEVVGPPSVEMDKEIEEPPEVEFTERPVYTEPESRQDESEPARVMSFDDLISKYKIDTAEPVTEPASDILTWPVSDESIEDSVVETIFEAPAETVPEKQFEFTAESIDSELKSPVIDPDAGQADYREEVVSEYGVFEEVIVRKSDLDLEAFDRSIEIIPTFNETIPAEITKPENGMISPEFSSVENETITENPLPEELSESTEERDYEAFDGPFEYIDEEENPTDQSAGVEMQSETPVYPENDTKEKEPEKPVIAFESKNAESIVFAPYHMVDYFASQGIKLVLEDQPADNFGKQLKSFTDWLKVMKKIPARPASDKTDEKEAERIRHFAAHSIEERDILTESMAEVLAKQGMYDNAIALYQKLSLIYPPKSAYFASRIEQLKASLP